MVVAIAYKNAPEAFDAFVRLLRPQRGEMVQRRKAGRDGKILSDHRQDEHVTVGGIR